MFPDLLLLSVLFKVFLQCYSDAELEIYNIPPPVVNRHVGETFQTTCRARGVPTPTIIWRKDFGDVSAKCRTSNENGIGTLICENIQLEDQGVFSCSAHNSRGFVFSNHNTHLFIKPDKVCPAGYFNSDARTETECIKCFCFGQSSHCQSADLFRFSSLPSVEVSSLKLLGVHIDTSIGHLDIEEEPIYLGLYSTIPEYSSLSHLNIVPYLDMPENYQQNQLRSYGGFLRYTVRHSNRHDPLPGPNVIISGNGYTLLHQSSQSPAPNTDENMEVRFFEGDWVIKSPGSPEIIATREEIMMVLEDIERILIKAQYYEGIFNTTVTNIEMDSASSDSGLHDAVYVEQCTCPFGYTGSSCEECDSGYTRHKSGPWLGKCYKKIVCPPGQYNDGRECQVCPCPFAPNQFATSCQIRPDGDFLCKCKPQYVGRFCEQCAPGFEGNPLVRGDYCKPIPMTRSHCNIMGSLDIIPDANGKCECKERVEGESCNQCKAKSFHLSSRNQFGCIPCFCMGVSQQCSSSNWYRHQISNVFTSSIGNFKIVDNLYRDMPLVPRLNLDSKEISFSNFTSTSAYYWSLPSKYLGNKLTSYGGFLRYSLGYSQESGGKKTRDYAADVELVSKNSINLRHFSQNLFQTHASQSLEVPLLEQYWQRSDGQLADREHLLMVLADLDAIYIKATYYTETRESSLISVSLDVANERKAGSLERALEVEQCKCPLGYVGLSCEDCDVGYYRTESGIYLGLCEPCQCNGHSNECDVDTGICLKCRNFTTGEHCEECLPGFTGNPKSGLPCLLTDITPSPCECDPRGSVSSECTNSRCTCKENVKGSTCNICRTGTFGLNAINTEGCETCFCSGVAYECSESSLYRDQILIGINSVDHGFTLTDQNQRIRISGDFDIDSLMNQISYQVPVQGETLYWSLPNAFTGNKIKSYGGKLEFSQKYTASGDYIPGTDIIINGNGITLYWKNPGVLKADKSNFISISIHPSTGWKRTIETHGVFNASREDFLIILANIDSILIRASVAQNMLVTSLREITLDTAVDSYTGQPRASNVEVCKCPPGYNGSSCESCSPGYYKDPVPELSRPLGSCLQCPCNNRETSCEMSIDNHLVCHCKPNYVGPNCEDDVSQDEEPIVVVSQSYIKVKENQSIEITCSATGIPKPAITISRIDGTPVNNHINGVLKVTRAQLSDSGVYICNASNRAGYEMARFRIIVSPAIDDIVKVNIEPANYTGTSGDAVILTCSSSAPRLSTKWSKEGDKLPNEAIAVRDMLIISKSRPEDSGVYLCTVISTSGTKGSSSVTVDILEEESGYPTVVATPEQISILQGQSTEIHCRVTSNSAHTAVKWVRLDGHLDRNMEEKGTTLFIRNAKVKDSGEYACEATNRHGTAQASVIVEVTPSVIPRLEIHPQIRQTVVAGQNTFLQCKAIAGIPYPTITWTRKNGLPLGTTIKQMASGTLRFTNISRDEDGDYICTATNAAGTATATANIIVHTQPEVFIKPDSDYVTKNVGESFSLECRGSGIPQPNVYWMKNDSTYKTSDQDGESQSTAVQNFDDLTTTDSGFYICNAENDAGSAEKWIQLKVENPPTSTSGNMRDLGFIVPKIEIQPHPNLTVMAGQTGILKCIALAGVPSPFLYWKREDSLPLGEKFEEISNGVLRFTNISKDEEGKYICTAHNHIGMTTERANLIVQDPFACHADEFQCSNKKCIWIIRRCNSEDDCGDGSDEANCPTNPPGSLCAYNEFACHSENQCIPKSFHCDSEVDCLDSSDEDGCTKPVISRRPPRTVILNIGETFTLTCFADGIPTPEIVWFRSWGYIPVKCTATSENGLGTLTCENIQVEDIGAYFCKAVNIKGSTPANSILYVKRD